MHCHGQPTTQPTASERPAAWVAVVPVKPLQAAKTRLRGAVPEAVHPDLVLAMARDTVAAALACRAVARVVVICDDPAVCAELTALGALCLPDAPAAGLNAALAYGAQAAQRPVSAFRARATDADGTPGAGNTSGAGNTIATNATGTRSATGAGSTNGAGTSTGTGSTNGARSATGADSTNGAGTAKGTGRTAGTDHSGSANGSGGAARSRSVGGGRGNGADGLNGAWAASSADEADVNRAQRDQLAASDRADAALTDSAYTPGMHPDAARADAARADAARADAARADAARADAVSVVALTADLPAMRPEDLESALAAAARTGRRAFVPDLEGTGTVLLAAPAGQALTPHFGPGSAAAHLRSGAVRLDGAWPSLRRDVDTAADLDAAARLGLGAHTGQVICTVA